MICSAAPPCSRSALNDNQKGLNQLGAVADPGFPVGGGGCRPPTRTLFGKNRCENERNGSCWGGGAPAAPPVPAN